MTYLHRTYTLQWALIVTTLLLFAVSSSLSVIYWYEEDRQDSQIEKQLATLSAAHESATTLQERDTLKVLREAVASGTTAVDIWRANKQENRLYDWRRIPERVTRPNEAAASGPGQWPSDHYQEEQSAWLGQDHTDIAWPVELHNPHFLNGEYANLKWRAVQGIASNQGAGDVLIRVYRPVESLSTYLQSRLSEVAFLMTVFAALAFGLSGWAASNALAPLDKLANNLEQVCDDTTTATPPQHSRLRSFEQILYGINDLLTTTKSQNKRMACFASETAHELRTPLTSMRIIGETALREPKNAAHLQECVGAILEECQQMDQLIEGILLIAQAKNKRVAIAITPVDLDSLAAECVDRLLPLAEASGISLELSDLHNNTNHSTLTVACDSALLRQAGINLINNAIVHNGPGTQITIRAESTATGPRLVIADTGVGFSTHSDEDTFRRGLTTHTLKTQNDGKRHLGLGLSIATSLVESQGAQLIIDSKVGGGTRVSIEFPNELRWQNWPATDSSRLNKAPKGIIATNVA